MNDEYLHQLDVRGLSGRIHENVCQKIEDPGLAREITNEVIYAANLNYDYKESLEDLVDKLTDELCAPESLKDQHHY